LNWLLDIVTKFTNSKKNCARWLQPATPNLIH
jgi:hypothetical protein